MKDSLAAWVVVMALVEVIPVVAELAVAVTGAETAAATTLPVLDERGRRQWAQEQQPRLQRHATTKPEPKQPTPQQQPPRAPAALATA